MTPHNLTPHQGEVFTVELFMSSEDELINAVGTTVLYDTDVLQLVSYRRTSEKVSFWLDAKDDPWDGSIRLEGLLVNNSWQGKSEKLARLTFRTIVSSNTSIDLDAASLHAYDGTGENIVIKAVGADVAVQDKAPRSEYAYKATGYTDVAGSVSADILYDDEYAREYRVIYLTPWWVWVVLGMATILWIVSFLQMKNLKRRMERLSR